MGVNVKKKKKKYICFKSLHLPFTLWSTFSLLYHSAVALPSRDNCEVYINVLILISYHFNRQTYTRTCSADAQLLLPPLSCNTFTFFAISQNPMNGLLQIRSWEWEGHNKMSVENRLGCCPVAEYTYFFFSFVGRL